MDAKTPKRKRKSDLFPYRAEDLEPRHTSQEIAAEDEYIERNRDAINEALREAYEDIKAGRVHPIDEVRKALARSRRSRKRKS